MQALLKRLDKRQEREDYHAALVASVIAEANRNPKKRHKPYTPVDFMPKKQKKAAVPKTADQMIEMFRLWNASVGGKEVVKQSEE